VAWTHRRTAGTEIYFISNQLDKRRTIDVSLRVTGRQPELWDPVSAEIREAGRWRVDKGRTVLPLTLEANQSVFVILRKPTAQVAGGEGSNWIDPEACMELGGAWRVSFETDSGGPAEPLTFNELTDWTSHTNPAVRFYSGTATYTKQLPWKGSEGQASRVWIDLGRVANLAVVTLNGVDCGTAWTAPCRVEVTGALKSGDNELRIEVTNPWHNRLVREASLPEQERSTWMNAPNRLEGKPLLPAGLLGPVRILTDQ
jgi:hypothetical protein